jgi:hypothetical protein
MATMGRLRWRGRTALCGAGCSLPNDPARYAHRLVLALCRGIPNGSSDAKTPINLGGRAPRRALRPGFAESGCRNWASRPPVTSSGLEHLKASLTLAVVVNQSVD